MTKTHRESSQKGVGLADRATREHSGEYGIDGSFHIIPARWQAIGLGTHSAALLVFAGMCWARGRRRWAAVALAVNAAVAVHVALYLHATRRGKFAVWNDLLDGLALRGDETVLGMGCGRGAVLLAAAKRVPRGRAIGVDLWQADQTGNSPEATLANAILENVADRVEVHTADMTALPLPDNSVDIVVSNLAIHNIPGSPGRRRALTEAIRVLRPGGRLLIADLWETAKHADYLRELGWPDVQRRSLGWRMWYGGPWSPTRLVSATKPG